MRLRIVEMPSGGYAVQKKLRLWFRWSDIGRVLIKHEPPRAPTYQYIFDTLAEAERAAQIYREEERRNNRKPIVIKELDGHNRGYIANLPPKPLSLPAPRPRGASVSPEKPKTPPTGPTPHPLRTSLPEARVTVPMPSVKLPNPQPPPDATHGGTGKSGR